MIQRSAETSSIPPERIVRNPERYGNTSAASIPVESHEASADRRIEEGTPVRMAAAGAGLASGPAIFQSRFR